MWINVVHWTTQVVLIISFCFRATSKPRKRRHGRSPTWPAVERYFDLRIAFDRKITRLLCRCLKLSTCAVRAFSSPSATCSPPRMTKRSASFSMNCPDPVLAGWCCPWWRQQHTGNCGKACRGWQGDSQHSTISLSGFLLKGRNDGGRVWRTR